MFWRKKTIEKNFSEKVARRVSKIPTADLPGWIEQSLYETNRTLSTYQASGDSMHLNDLLLGAEAVNALISELYNRHVL
jgi:hypothetical protein